MMGMMMIGKITAKGDNLNRCKKCGTPTYHRKWVGRWGTTRTFANKLKPYQIVWHDVDTCPKCEHGLNEIEALDDGYYDEMTFTKWLCVECGGVTKLDKPTRGDSGQLQKLVCDWCCEGLISEYESEDS
jgi:hypothetical protein